jgi:N utilization substance protein B
MVSRNMVRIKVMQAIYEYNMSAEPDIATARKSLVHSFNDMYMLYIRILALFGALTGVAEQVIERKKQKFLPSETDLHPNFKFVDNAFIKKIEANKSLQHHIQNYNLGWNNDVDLLFVRKLYTEISNQDFFINHMRQQQSSFEEDKDLILLILRFMLENENINHYFGELKLSWWHDYNDVIILIHNTLKTFSKNQSDDKPLPPLFKVEPDGISEDRQFMLTLLEKTLTNNAQYEQIIADKIRNWETGRVACVDFILLKMAICEFCEFPSIPLRVTLNEYIEISKYYSTPKSGHFVNGLLDSILDALKEENKINKQGRGLMG